MVLISIPDLLLFAMRLGQVSLSLSLFLSFLICQMEVVVRITWDDTSDSLIRVASTPEALSGDHLSTLLRGR